MKVIAYAVRADELEAFKKFEKHFNMDITICHDYLSEKTAHLAKGHETVIFIGSCEVTASTLKILSGFGITYMSTRTAGYDNIDKQTAQELGIRIANVPAYSPNSAGEFAILSTISLLRNYVPMLTRMQKQNFSLGGLLSKEVRNQRIGIIGGGRIGLRTMECFSGFKPKEIMVTDNIQHDEVKKIAKYVSLDTLLAESDVISIHTDLNETSQHIFNKENLAKTKQGVFIVNTSRGATADTRAILDALNSGHIAGYATDVYEHEGGLLHHNHEGKKITDTLFLELLNHPKVILSPHYAFYTDEAVANMVEYSIENINDYKTRNTCINEIIPLKVHNEIKNA